MLSFPECITWLGIGLTECVTIVTLNVITIIIFIKNRNLRKRSTYLIINLAVVDMLAGAFGIYVLFYDSGAINCEVWNTPIYSYILDGVAYLFPICSTTNMTAISLERLHATRRPFRHRVLKKWVYVLTITVVWVTAGLLSIVLTVLGKFKDYRNYFYLWNLFSAICLLIICISYSSIVIKVRCGAQPQHHGAANRERKLTMTLSIVTVVSLLFYLPNIVYRFLLYTGKLDILPSLPYSVVLHINNAIVVLFYANSLVNPILYTIRMSEYRSAVLALFRRRRQVAVLPLHGM